jgi:hypothetical protein
MRRIWLLLYLLLFVAASLPGYCTIPSFRGYTGLMVVPTADALGKGDWNAGFFYENVANETINDVVANYGIAQGFEFGIDRFRLNEDRDHQTLLNAKYRFMPEAGNRPAVAAGINDITDDIDTTVYVVASKTLGCSIRAWKGETLTPRVHVGFGGGRLSGLFGGVSAWVGNRVELMAEWDSKDVKVGLRWRFTPEFTIHGGGFNLNDRDDDPFSTGASFGVGASWNMVY